MKPRLFLPTPACFAFTVILAISVHLPAIWSQEPRPYDVCGESIQCGNIRVEYPFWGFDRPAYCGHPGFQLTCQSNVPVLSYQSLNYRVLDIDTSVQTITIARNDLWTTNCPQPLYNTTYNSTLFSDNNLSQEDVSLYYDCNSTTIPRIPPLTNNYQFTCDVNGNEREGYFFRTDLIVSNVANFLVQCENHIDVPVNQASATQLAAPTIADDLRSALTAGFNLTWTANYNECSRCIQSNGQCGSNSTSPDLFVCYCANGNLSFTCTDTNEGGGSKGAARKLIIGISCGIVGMLLFMLFAILCRPKRLWETQCASGMTENSHFQETSRNNQIEIFIRNYGAMTPKRYKYSEIKKITNSFLEKLGKGGFGSVYKGQLPDGKLVAVKLLTKATGDGEDFINEVDSIGRTSHVNVVTLLGFCFDGTKKALIYEFMPNGSLDKFLHGDGSRLNRNTLFQIAKGIARGLEYLHRGCNTRIVHFDIKPHNVLLDEEFVPKISDFGLAKLCKSKESIVSVTGARGTVGYIAPEVFFRSLGGASHKSDVYSYGMMVLEMTGARKHNIANSTDMSSAYFPDTIYKKVEGGENLGVDGVTTKEEDELARKMVMVSLWCIQSDPSDRPSISKVVEMLEGSFQSLQIPPKRFWSSPTRYSQRTSPSATQSSSNERVLTMHTARKDFSS